MCLCSSNVQIQEYQNQIEVSVPNHISIPKNCYIDENEDKFKTQISIDTCLVDEIKGLWELGIVTTGCCCGHNKQLPYIGVDELCIDKMLELGYVIKTNLLDISRRDSFYPKGITSRPKMIEAYIKHLIKINYLDKRIKGGNKL